MAIELAQQAVCKTYGSAFSPAPYTSKLGLALSTLKLEPIYGVRESASGDSAGWYIWGGPYSDAENFFQPVHIEHLIELLPAVLPFLALESGFKFIIDKAGYVDVWRES